MSNKKKVAILKFMQLVNIQVAFLIFFFVFSLLYSSFGRNERNKKERTGKRRKMALQHRARHRPLNSFEKESPADEDRG